MAGVKKYEELRDRAEAQRDESEAELAMTMSELEDLLGGEGELAETAMTLQSLKPSDFKKLLHATLLGNPFLIQEVLMAAGDFVDDAHRVLHDEGRGYRQDAKVMERARKDLMRSMGEIMRTKALDKYDEIVNDWTPDEED